MAKLMKISDAKLQGLSIYGSQLPKGSFFIFWAKENKELIYIY
jgi:hypothetical protein